MIPFDFITPATLLVLASGAALPCQIPKAAEITVVPKSAPVKYDTTQTTAQIQAQDIDTINPYGFDSATHTNGYMKGLISMRPKVKLDYNDIPNTDQVCIWYDTVAIDILIDPTIVIPKEVAADPCMNNAVRTHEMKHVMVDRRVVNKYAKTMGKKVFEGLQSRGFVVGPVKGADAQTIAARMHKTVSQLVELEYRKMDIERAEKQQAVDNIDEYQAVQAQCPNYKPATP